MVQRLKECSSFYKIDQEIIKNKLKYKSYYYL